MGLKRRADLNMSINCLRRAHSFIHFSSLKHLYQSAVVLIYNLNYLGWEAEGGGWEKIHDLSGLHSKFKDGLSNLVRSCFKL